MKTLLVVLFLLLTCSSTAQVSVDSIDFIYTQNFNNLASSGISNTWTNNITLEGWYASNAVSGEYYTYRAVTGTSTGLYSFGTEASDRALGSLNQNASGDMAYGLLLTNNSGDTIKSVTITFAAEQWRRAKTKTKGFHRVTLSYQMAIDIDTSASNLINGTFVSIPEGYLLTPDTTSIANHQALDGNNSENRDSIYIKFPISWPAGEEVFIRFYDDNATDIDHAMAIDNLNISFDTIDILVLYAQTDYEVGAYLEATIVKDIPDESDGIPFTKVSESDFASLSSLFESFYSGNYTEAATLSSSYGYVYVEAALNGDNYHVLRKKSNSSFFWGTYITASSPTKSCVTIQAPHPIVDSNTGQQAAHVFQQMNASNLMISGIDRCTSSQYVECSGTTKVCGIDEKFRISDPAHNDSTAFHVASAVLNDLQSSMVFVQLHGFEQKEGDPEFIFSNGTPDTPSNDYLASLDAQFQSYDPSLEVDLVHMDTVTKLKAFTNVFGRILNSYPNNICTDGGSATSSSGRFLHLEQYGDFRADIGSYADLATMLGNAISCEVSLPIHWIGFRAFLYKNQTVHLSWEVTNQFQAKEFIVERSENQNNFRTLSTIPLQKEKYSYDFWDRPQKGVKVSFYRIRQVNPNGASSYSAIKSINFNTPVSNLKIFPNPASNTVHIIMLNEFEVPQLKDISGRQVVVPIRKNQDIIELDLSDLPKGLYAIHYHQQVNKVIKK